MLLTTAAMVHQLVDFVIEFARREGTSERVLVDIAEARQTYSRVKRLVFAGVQVRWVLAERMHAKSVVIDSSTLLTGSLNWTLRASQRNVEHVLVLADMPNIVRQVTRSFNALWTSATRALRAHFSTEPPSPEPVHQEDSDLAQALADFERLVPGVFERGLDVLI